MKIKKIINLCKASNTILLYTDENADVQYLSNGSAIYLLSINPPITTETVCILNDITEKKRGEMKIETADITELDKIDVSDGTAASLPADLADITIASQGVTFVPFYSELGILLIDKSYLSPFSDAEDLSYYVRTTAKHGQPYLVITKGLLFCAAIMPMSISEKLIKDTDILHTALKFGFNLQKQIEANRRESFKIDETAIDVSADDDQ